MLTKEETLSQSQRAYQRWGSLWRHNCAINKDIPKIESDCIKNLGIGKHLLLVAFGPSLSKQIETIKMFKYQEKVDIMCVDKAFPMLMENGIKPEFVFLADARISYEVYCEKYVNKTKNICLISNVNGNPNWGLNWKGPKTYYVNKDNIKSEKEFGPMSGCSTFIHAASNVSNGQIVYSNHILKYDKYILAGYDFSWEMESGFYAKDKFSTKKVYLNQVRSVDLNGGMVCTSENLSFSCRWLESYIIQKVGADKVVNSSEAGILNIPLIANLKDQLGEIRNYQRKLTKEEIQLINTKTLTVSDKPSFEHAKQIINSDDHEVFGLSISYAKKMEDDIGNAKATKN